MMNENDEKELEHRRNAERVADWSPLSQWSYEKRLQAAKNFGPNWASVLSGCGDQ
jgi:hypothetical protein